jgi:uncharacterized protein (TIGR02246 family)
MTKTKNYAVALLGAATFFFVSCSNPAPEAPKAINLDELRVEIQAMEDAYAAGEAAKDADAVVAYYSDDAVSYNRSEEPTVGKEAIRARIAERMAKDSSNSKNVYKVVDLYADGDMAVEIGSWTEMDSTGAESAKGYYMSYFQKRDGKYLCVRDMNVKIAPAAAPAPEAAAAPATKP